MPYSLIQAQAPTGLIERLDGVLFGTFPLKTVKIGGPGTEEVLTNLNGLKLEFTTPAVTVTFATVNPISLSDMLTELNAQVQATDANFLATVVSSKKGPGSVDPTSKVLRMVTTTPAGIELDLAPTLSTAGLLLGFHTAVGRVLSAAPIDSTKVVFMGDTLTGSHYVILAP